MMIALVDGDESDVCFVRALRRERRDDGRRWVKHEIRHEKEKASVPPPGGEWIRKKIRVVQSVHAPPMCPVNVSGSEKKIVSADDAWRRLGSRGRWRQQTRVRMTAEATGNKGTNPGTRLRESC
jgi:hypothetical protein